MKKILLLVLVTNLILISLVFAGEVAFVRDTFNTAKHYAFIPVDKSIGKWIRVDFHCPKDNFTSYPKYSVVDQIFYGVVRPGLVFFAGYGTDFTESGTWSNDGAHSWTYKSNSTQTNYLEVLIPAGYNRIQLLSYNVSGGNGALLNIAWDDASTTGLDVTAYDSGDNGTGVRDVVVATNASPDGIKKLRITHNDSSGTARIIGLRCWDTDSIADPTITRSGDADAFLGNDFVDTYGDAALYRVATDCTLIGIRQVAYEFAVRLAPTGNPVKWVGGDQHFGSGQATYTYHSGEYPDGPELFVDGSSVGGVFAMNRNELQTGDEIFMHSTGWADYDEAGDEDATEPDLTWTTSIDRSGIIFSVSILFNEDSDIGSAYSPMLSPYTGLGTIYFPPDKTPVSATVGAMEFEETGLMEIIPDVATDLMITMSAFSPCDQIGSYSNGKLYAYIQKTAMPGGITPSSGDLWLIGGRLQFSKIIGLSRANVRIAGGRY